MGELELYSTIRNEIVVNHVLMHLTTIFVVFMLVGGTWFVETRRSFVSLLLPLLSLAWAATIVRFYFVIHRQGAYLRLLEASLQERVAPGVLFWELTKAQFRSTRYVVPTVDGARPADNYRSYHLSAVWAVQISLQRTAVGGHLLYAWTVLLLIALLLSSLPFILGIAAV